MEISKKEIDKILRRHLLKLLSFRYNKTPSLEITGKNGDKIKIS